MYLSQDRLLVISYLSIYGIETARIVKIVDPHQRITTNIWLTHSIANESCLHMYGWGLFGSWFRDWHMHTETLCIMWFISDSWKFMKIWNHWKCLVLYVDLVGWGSQNRQITVSQRPKRKNCRICSTSTFGVTPLSIVWCNAAFVKVWCNAAFEIWCNAACEGLV